MTDTVMCRKYGKELPALAKPPQPGPKGLEIQQTISQQAWQEWLAHQTMLINEKQLSMMDPEARKFLTGEMEKFMDNKEFAKAEGYVPENDDSGDGGD